MKNREIKFRGRCIKSGRYVYGDLVKWSETKLAIYCLRDGGHDVFIIDPGTEGQFTGLLDKNGKEIFEGDIVQICNNKNGLLLVEFKNQYVGGWVLTYPESHDLSLGVRQHKDIEIIGNIHEHPNLLKL